MKQETKVIYSAIDSLESMAVPSCDSNQPIVEDSSSPPSIGSTVDADNKADNEAVEAVSKSMSYRSLKKGARDIMELNASNFNELLKQQKYKFPKIENVSFIEFQFGTSALLGMFKASYIDNSTNRLVETSLFASWDGASLHVI